MQTFKEARSGINMANVQEVIDASVSAKHATLGNQQQYETGPKYAEFFAGLLPANPDLAFDPQCASGNTITHGIPHWCRKVGFELDRRFLDKDDGVHRVIGNCVTSFQVLDELFPDLRFECINANPPFGLLWKMPDGGKMDSTEYTWRKVQERLAENGYGYFISNYKTIERLKIHEHPRVYLYQRFPSGVWQNCDVEIGVVHFDAHPDRPKRVDLQYFTLNLGEHAGPLDAIKRHYQNQMFPRGTDNPSLIMDAFTKVQEVIDEEKKNIPPFNIYLDKSGDLRTYLSTRATLKQKLTREQVIRLSRVNEQSPLTLTTDRETRKLMAELVNCGLYTIQPEAKAAISDALEQVKALSAPICPVTDFETVAHADEEDTLECILDCHVMPEHVNNLTGLDPSMCNIPRQFTKGKHYELSTAGYRFVEEFIRNKAHFIGENEETGEEGHMETVAHKCSLSGTDRYIQIVDDLGMPHRFMDKPNDKRYDHEEKLLWSIFKKPIVKTIAETHPEEFQKNKLMLSTCEMLADFTYYPGQLDYLARVGIKDYGIVAASTGCGKTLMAISLLQMKGPSRALIIAPQGTMKAQNVDLEADNDEDEDSDEPDKPEAQAAQWIQELRRFAPGMPVFQLFSMDDYTRICDCNGGKLPEGAIYVTYFEAMFSNGARETSPKSWTDERLAVELSRIVGTSVVLPEAEDSLSNTYWTDTVGHERNGIRCIITPCMSTQIGHLFDMVVVDEGHKVCNLGACVTQMLIRLQPKYRYLCTATPIPNVVGNLFSLMGWICVKDWYKGKRRNAAWPYAREDFQVFIDTFQVVERDYTQEALNEANAIRGGNYRYRRTKCEKPSPVISSPARLLKILKPNMAYISKPMCNPNYQPPKLVDIRVQMGTQQTVLYSHFMNRSNIEGRNPLVRARKQITYLRNICADPMGFTHGGPRVTSNFNPKTVAILELCRDILSKGDQVTIVCARKGQSDTIHMALRDAGVLVSRIDTTVAAAQHAAQANAFKAKRTQAMIMGIKSAVAHSFSECPFMIIGSLEYSFGSLEQARGRVDRVNSAKPATIYCVLHKHSIEETMYDTVAIKQDACEICLQGKRVPRDYKPLDMSEVLADAITNFKEECVNERDCESQWPVLRGSLSVALRNP